MLNLFPMRRFLLASSSLLVLAGCGVGSLHRSDTPLSRAEASKYISFKLPASAKEVYFVQESEWQEFEEFVRFAVDADQMDATVEALLAGHTPASLGYSSEAERSFQPMTWWTPSSIIHGQYRTGDHQPIFVWTDTDNHRVFVFKSD